MLGTSSKARSNFRFQHARNDTGTSVGQSLEDRKSAVTYTATALGDSIASLRLLSNFRAQHWKMATDTAVLQNIPSKLVSCQEIKLAYRQ